MTCTHTHIDRLIEQLEAIKATTPKEGAPVNADNMLANHIDARTATERVAEAMADALYDLTRNALDHLPDVATRDYPLRPQFTETFSDLLSDALWAADGPADALRAQLEAA